VAQIIGQIESLKRLKKVLNENGIDRFSSIGQINQFLKGYHSEVNKVKLDGEREVTREINALKATLLDYQQQYEQAKVDARTELELKIASLDQKIDRLKASPSKNLFIDFYNWLKLEIAEAKLNNLKHNGDQLITNRTRAIHDQLSRTAKSISDLTQNKELVISQRIQRSIDALKHTKKVVDGLYPSIAGAVGENLVVKQLEQLGDDFIVINDYVTRFDPPIYNRKENDRIFSVQIDHLVVCRAGVFILETKNWSKSSVENLDLRSPVKQIRRASYALFVVLNSKSRKGRFTLKRHHWGKKQIAINNVVVMINNKPKEQFNFVAIKSLAQLNSYITRFEPVLSDAEVDSIANYLLSIKA